MEVEGVRSQSWQKMALLFFPVHPTLEICPLCEFRWKWVFLKGSGCWVIGGSGYLALKTWRGNATPRSSEPWCWVSSLSHLGCRCFLCCSIFTVQHNRGTY
jgi:hypothetical protein